MGQDDDEKIVFATIALTTFVQARNWQLGHEKYASIFFATLALTVFAQARTLRLSYEKYASILFAAFGLTVSQHLSKCYQHIFYEFYGVGDSTVCFLKKLC